MLLESTVHKQKRLQILENMLNTSTLSQGSRDVSRITYQVYSGSVTPPPPHFQPSLGFKTEAWLFLALHI